MNENESDDRDHSAVGLSVDQTHLSEVEKRSIAHPSGLCSRSSSSDSNIWSLVGINSSVIMREMQVMTDNSAGMDKNVSYS